MIALRAFEQQLKDMLNEVDFKKLTKSSKNAIVKDIEECINKYDNDFNCIEHVRNSADKVLLKDNYFMIKERIAKKR